MLSIAVMLSAFLCSSYLYYFHVEQCVIKKGTWTGVGKYTINMKQVNAFAFCFSVIVFCFYYANYGF